MREIERSANLAVNSFLSIDLCLKTVLPSILGFRSSAIPTLLLFPVGSIDSAPYVVGSVKGSACSECSRLFSELVLPYHQDLEH